MWRYIGSNYGGQVICREMHREEILGIWDETLLEYLTNRLHWVTLPKQCQNQKRQGPMKIHEKIWTNLEQPLLGHACLHQ